MAVQDESTRAKLLFLQFFIKTRVLKFIINYVDENDMKCAPIITLIILLTSLTTGATESDSQSQSSSRFMQQIISDNPKMARALEIKEVQEVYNNCFKLQHDNGGVVEGKRLMDCMWMNVQQDENLKQQVLDTMAKDTSGKERNIASVQYERSVNIKEGTNPGLLALQDYYSKRLEEALYGGAVDKNSDTLIKTKRTADQKVFFQLYKSQLGKNILASLSSYCIEAAPVRISGPAGTFSIPMIYEDKGERETKRKQNLKSLNQTATNPQSGESTLRASSNWNSCITNIQYVCHQPTHILKQDGDTILKTAFMDNTENLLESCISEREDLFKEKEDKAEKRCLSDIDYSKKRACVVTQYLTEAKRNLGVLDKTMELYSKIGNSGNGSDGVKFYKDASNKKSIDELTSITSQEAVDSGYASAKNEELEKFKECLNDDNTVNNEEACKAYLSEEKDKYYATLAEFKLKQEATFERLKNIDPSDKKQIEEILIQDGYNEEEAKELANYNDIKMQIEQKYKNKKDALLADFADRIDDMTVSGDKLNTDQSSEDIAKLMKIREGLKNDTQKFAELVHFNNIVSSYLQIEDSEGNSSKNTAALSRELASNAFTKENRDKNSSEHKVEINNNTGIADYGNFEQKVQQTGIELEDANANSGSNETRTLTVKEINSYLLNFFAPPQE